MTRKRVVVVGAGMVGSRFAEELTRADREDRFDVELLGDEGYGPYNRVLLTELLAGRVDLAALALPEHPGVRLRPDAAVTGIDRDRRIVRTETGEVAYDHLVLATGARARIPAVPGLTDGLPRGVHVLRSLNDAREIAAATLNARRAVVIGGGPLGVEAAAGLRHRGVEVDIVSIADTLLDRDLDHGPGALLAAAAADLGMNFYGEVGLSAVTQHAGRVNGVQLDDGTRLPTDLLVLACGAVPEVGLAREAGLDTERGVMVGDDLRTPQDRAISAIGDCAQTPSGVAGLIAPGWDQARLLAGSLVGGAEVAPVPVVIDGAAMRLKAVGLSLVSMGRRASSAGDGRVVTLTDPDARRYVEMVVEGDVLVGVTCLGSPDLAAQLSVQFDRPGMVSTDPIHLLTGGGSGGATQSAGSPTTMPSSTTVCRCNGVTKRQLVHAWEDGATSVDALARETRATTGCGGCRSLVCGIAEWLESSEPGDTSQPAERPSESIVPSR